MTSRQWRKGSQTEREYCKSEMKKSKNLLSGKFSASKCYTLHDYKIDGVIVKKNKIILFQGKSKGSISNRDVRKLKELFYNISEPMKKFIKVVVVNSKQELTYTTTECPYCKYNGFGFKLIQNSENETVYICSECNRVTSLSK